MLYKFKEKGPAFGLGHVEGEIVEYDPKKKVTATALVPEVDANNRPTNKMVLASKEYTVDYLIDSGVIVPASEEDQAKFKAKLDRNSLADKAAAEAREREAQMFKNRVATAKV